MNLEGKIRKLEFLAPVEHSKFPSHPTVEEANAGTDNGRWEALIDVLRELAAQAKAIGEINLAARRLEIALELDDGHLDVRRDLVSVYERAGRKADAARELATLCAELERRGDVKQAQEALERATPSGWLTT